MTRLKQSLLDRYSEACERCQRAVFLRQAAHLGMLMCVGGASCRLQRSVHARRDSGYWADFENLRRELVGFAVRQSGEDAVSMAGDGEGQGSFQGVEDTYDGREEDGQEGSGLDGAGVGGGSTDDVRTRGAGMQQLLREQEGLGLDPAASRGRSGGDGREATGSEREEVSSGRPGGEGRGRAGDMRRLPSQQELLRAGRSDLVHAIRHWGGAVEVARLLGLPARRGCAPPLFHTAWSSTLELGVAFVLVMGRRGGCCVSAVPACRARVHAFDQLPISGTSAV